MTRPSVFSRLKHIWTDQRGFIGEAGGDGAGGGAAAVADHPSASSGSTGSSSATGSTGAAASQPSKWEDDPRAKGMLADLQKERRARQDYERRQAEYETKLAERQRQIEALTGTRPIPKDQIDDDLVTAKLHQLIPGLDQLGSIAEIRQALEQQQVNGYTNHSKGMLNQIYTGIAAEYGDLTDAQKKRINAAYLIENQLSPEFHARHNAGDPTLVAEFVKAYLTDMVEPLKRKFTVADSFRMRKVPSGKDRSLHTRGEKPVDAADPKAVKDMLAGHWKNTVGR